MRLRSPERDERGAIAVMTALLLVVLLAVAAFAVDISSQVNARQKLHDTVDAAAHAAAYRLPSSGALAAPDAVALVNKYAAVTPGVEFFCVVAALASGSVDTSQIPATCKPTSAGSSYAGYKCNDKICSIPCKPESGDLCNTARVAATKPVPFSFGPAIGIDEGSTGEVASAACKGSCGTIAPNPMDVAVVADRTGSMVVGGHDDTVDLVAGVKGMLQVMDPSQQYVALGTIGRSKQGAAPSCLSQPSTVAAEGPWVPVPFSNDYLGSGTAVNPSSTLVKAVDCLTPVHSSSGTHLASPMKAAARYMLGYDTNNLGSLPARTGVSQKAIIFETDGAPNEKFTGGSTGLSSTSDIGSTATGNDTACTNFKTVATNTKGEGILVITVAFNVSTVRCNTAGGSAMLVDTMAAAASPAVSGAASAADFDCGSAAGRTAENADGDFFFCAAPGDAMAPIFKTAIGQLSSGIRLIRLP